MKLAAMDARGVGWSTSTARTSQKIAGMDAPRIGYAVEPNIIKLGAADAPRVGCPRNRAPSVGCRAEWMHEMCQEQYRVVNSPKA